MWNLPVGPLQLMVLITWFDWALPLGIELFVRQPELGDPLGRAAGAAIKIGPVNFAAIVNRVYI